MKRLMLAGLILLVGCSNEEVYGPKEEPKIVEEKKEEATKEPETVETEETTTEKTTPPPTTTTPPEETFNLNMTEQSFSEELLSKYEDFSLDLTKTESAVKNTFFYQVNSLTDIITKTNLDNTLKDVRVRIDLNGEVTNLDTVDFILAYSSIVSIISPEMTEEEKSKLVFEDLSIEVVLEYPEGKTITKGNINYTLKYFENGYLILYARNINDKEEFNI